MMILFRHVGALMRVLDGCWLPALFSYFHFIEIAADTLEAESL